MLFICNFVNLITNENFPKHTIFIEELNNEQYRGTNKKKIT